MGLLFSNENGGFGAISVMERSSPSSILKVFKWIVTYRIGFCETFYVKWRQPNPSVFSKTKLTLGSAHGVILWEIIWLDQFLEKIFHGFFQLFAWTSYGKSVDTTEKRASKMSRLWGAVSSWDFNKSLWNLAILLILRLSFECCQRIFPNLSMSKVEKNHEKVYWLERTYAVSMGVFSCGRAHTTRRF